MSVFENDPGIRACSKVHDDMHELCSTGKWEEACAYMDALHGQDINLLKTALIYTQSLKNFPAMKEGRARLREDYERQCRAKGFEPI